MKLLPFNKEMRLRLIQRGDRLIEIKEEISGEFSWLSDDKKLQILKAVENNAQVNRALPGKLEYISSERIDHLLSDKSINSYIIVNSMDEQ